MQTNCKIHFEKSKELLKAGGLKITPARVALLDILNHAKKPLSIKEISAYLGKTDIVTLYRNIQSLEILNLVKGVHIDNNQSYYELSGGEHHHHLICKTCGKISDIKGCSIKMPKNIEKKLLKQNEFGQISGHSLEFFGICKNCMKG